MKTLSTDRVIAQISECSVSSSADLGNLLLAFVEGKSYPMTASEAHLEIIKKVKALRFNDKDEKRDFVSELTLWVKDGRLPIPDTDLALEALLALHRTLCRNAPHTFDAFTELRSQFKVSHSFYGTICQFIRTRVINMPKNIASWSLIVTLMANNVKWIYIEGLTYNKTIDIVDADTLYHYVNLGIIGKTNRDHTDMVIGISYFIELVLSGDVPQDKLHENVIGKLKWQRIYGNTLNSTLKTAPFGQYFLVHDILPTFIGTELVYGNMDNGTQNLEHDALELISTIIKENPTDARLAVTRFFKYLPIYVLANCRFFPNEFILHLGFGNNIRTYGNFARLISKKAMHIFHNLQVGELANANNSLIYAHFKSLDVHTELIDKLLTIFRLDFHQIDNCTDEQWAALTAVALFFRNQSTTFLALTQQEQISLLGYISHCLRDVAGYSLKGRTIVSVQRDANAWYAEHERRFAILYPVVVKTWKIAAYKEWNLLGDDNQWYAIFQLTKQAELDDESAAMSHCVRIYSFNCESGHCSIWSLRVRINRFWVRLATIEVSKAKQIVQIKGKYNAIPAEKYLCMVQDWAAKEGLSVVRY